MLNELFKFPPSNHDQYLLKLAHINVRNGDQPPHNHDFAEIFIILEGKAVNVINGIETKSTPGDVYMLLPGMRHELISAENYRFCILKFDYEALLKEAGDIKNLPLFQLIFVLEPKLRLEKALGSNPFLDAATLSCVEHLAAVLENEMTTKPREYEKISKDIFMSVISLICRYGKLRTKTRDAAYSLSIASALSYMEQYFGESITIDMLAGKTHYSPRHFSRLFRECFKISPMAYLQNIRLAKACDLLLSTDHSISAVSEMCGFYDSSLFCRQFKKHFGITPLQYRNPKAV
jgi:AraC-like DNA-binding protein